MKRLLLVLLLLAVFCLGLAISYYNAQPVPFDYLAGTVNLPLIGLLVCSFVLGMLLAGALNLAANWVLKRESRRLQRQLNATEVELRTLRHLPLASSQAPAPPAPAKNA